jgi:hypothetical protein
VTETVLWAVAILAGAVGAVVVAIYLFRPPD